MTQTLLRLQTAFERKRISNSVIGRHQLMRGDNQSRCLPHREGISLARHFLTSSLAECRAVFGVCRGALCVSGVCRVDENFMTPLAVHHSISIIYI